MNIANIQTQSNIYGPGTRFVIWVQGCSLRCPGCWNRQMWDSTPKVLYSIEELLEQINNTSDIEGLTILGGEPFEQYEEVLDLCFGVQHLGLSIMLFTGYEMEELKDRSQTEILEIVDILITGRYDKNLRTTQHQWIGSTNQTIHFLSDRYADYTIQNANYVEIHIEDDGHLKILGFPHDRF